MDGQPCCTGGTRQTMNSGFRLRRLSPHQDRPGGRPQNKTQRHDAEIGLLLDLSPCFRTVR